MIGIYIRRSVDAGKKGNNSISLEVQQKDCISYAQSSFPNQEYRIYCDNGKSGKDIAHRPTFLEMLGDIEDGFIDTVIVKKYDRFGRNLLESLQTLKMLEKLNVAVISVDQNIDTSTPQGRVVLYMMLAMAESERDMTSDRVADNFDNKARMTGFYQGGKMYYGYTSIRHEMYGKQGSMLIPSEQSYVVIKAYELYKDPSIGLSKIIKYFSEHQIDTTTVYKGKRSKQMDRSHLGRILGNAIYVRANADVYRYFAAQGFEMIDDISAYDGVHGLFVHTMGKVSDKAFVKVGLHEGLVDADTWLSVQEKKSHQEKFHGKNTARRSWLVGLVKCAHCKYSAEITGGWNADKTKYWRYYHDSGYYRPDKSIGCKKRTLKIRPDDVETYVLEAMKSRLNSLVIAKHKSLDKDPKIEEINAQIISIDTEINGLVAQVANASPVLIKHIDSRVQELDKKRNELKSELQRLFRKRRDINTKPLEEPLNSWDSLDTEQKNKVAKSMIEVIYIADELDPANGVDTNINIIFKV